MILSSVDAQSFMQNFPNVHDFIGYEIPFELCLVLAFSSSIAEGCVFLRVAVCLNYGVCSSQGCVYLNKVICT